MIKMLQAIITCTFLFTYWPLREGVPPPPPYGKKVFLLTFLLCLYFDIFAYFSISENSASFLLIKKPISVAVSVYGPVRNNFFTPSLNGSLMPCKKSAPIV